MDLAKWLAQETERLIREEVALKEEWAEKSLTDPEGRGVLIIRYHPGSSIVYIGLDASVPWGTIHEYPNGKDDFPAPCVCAQPLREGDILAPCPVHGWVTQ